jgi:hypothetical protein
MVDLPRAFDCKAGPCDQAVNYPRSCAAENVMGALFVADEGSDEVPQ